MLQRRGSSILGLKCAKVPSQLAHSPWPRSSCRVTVDLSTELARASDLLGPFRACSVFLTACWLPALFANVAHAVGCFHITALLGYCFDFSGSAVKACIHLFFRGLGLPSFYGRPSGQRRSGCCGSWTGHPWEGTCASPTWQPPKASGPAGISTSRQYCGESAGATFVENLILSHYIEEEDAEEHSILERGQRRQSPSRSPSRQQGVLGDVVGPEPVAAGERTDARAATLGRQDRRASASSVLEPVYVFSSLPSADTLKNIQDGFVSYRTMNITRTYTQAPVTTTRKRANAAGK